jgi:hypothetical protein
LHHINIWIAEDHCEMSEAISSGHLQLWLLMSILIMQKLTSPPWKTKALPSDVSMLKLNCDKCFVVVNSSGTKEVVTFQCKRDVLYGRLSFKS